MKPILAPHLNRAKLLVVAVSLLIILIGRLFYGLTKFSGQDEFQVYLIP